MTNGYAVIAESKNHKTYLIPPPVIDPTGGHFLQSPKEGGNRLHVMKRSLALLLVFLLALSCIPLGTVTAFAAENEDSQPPSDTPPTEAPQTEPAETEEPNRESMLFSASPASDDDSGSSGSEVGDGSDGSGDTAGSGSSNMIAVGVTMQIVYYRYDECYNRYNSHGNVIETVQSGKAIPWNDTGKDLGETVTTVFDTFTISPHTFIAKAMWNTHPYIYHFPNDTLKENLCTFYWVDFANFWFEIENPGNKPSTYPRIVRNEENGSLAIENFLKQIIMGSSYGAWDKLDVAKGETVETDTSLFAAVLKYLGASDLAIQNYLDAYHGKLSVSQDGDTLIPTIIWAWVGAECLGGVSRLYTTGDVAGNASSNNAWIKTPYTSGNDCISGFETCSWMKNSTDTMICKLMLGATHSSGHNTAIWKEEGSAKLYGTGLVNRIQTQVDATDENGTNTFYYLRGYWTPYGQRTGSISLTKTNVAGTANLAGAEFTLYRDPGCTTPVTSSDYSALNTSDLGFVSAGVRITDSGGMCQWTGLYSGTYFLKETKAPEGYRVNVDTAGNVEVKEVAVGTDSTDITLTNAENTKTVSLKKSINASGECIDQIKGSPLYSLSGAEYTITLNGKVVETLRTDANGNAISTRQYNIGDVLTIKETKAPPGYKLDTRTYTHTVTSGDNVISVSDIPIFDPPFVLTKVDKDTTNPQGDGSFAGAVFKWEFFSNNDWSGTPARIWFFATDSNGKCVYDKSYLASGYTSDALYVSPAGVNQLPLGTVKITEVNNSLGYTVIDKPLYCTITQDSSKASGAKHVWTEESKAILTQMANGDWGVYEPIDTDLFGSVSLDKYDAVTGQMPQGEATLKGAKFQIINSSANAVVVNGKTYTPGAVICTLTTDSKGHAQTGNIFPIGTYTIRESEAPTGYLLNKDWQKTFSVTESKKDHSFSYADSLGCPETVISGKIRITKGIVNTVDNISAPEPGAKFSVTDHTGTVVDTIITGENGIGTSVNLPYGTYTIIQISGQAGTSMCDSWTVTVSEHGKVYEYTKENPLWTAAVSLHKKEAGTDTPLVATFELCERLSDGTIKVLETGTTDASGNLAFTRRIVYADGICNKSTYFIRESAAPAGYVLDTREYPVSCTENNQVISVTLENSPVLGKLELRKRSSTGVPMMGVEFLLEFSLDEGKTWNQDGRVQTNEDGIAVFDSLKVCTADGKQILYRVIETKTLNGSMLMPGPIWEGHLVGDGQYHVVLGIANSPILELPATGSKSLAAMPLSILLCLGICAAALFALRKKEV